MSEIVVGIKLKADGSGLVGQLTNAKGQVVQFGNATTVAGQKAKASGRNISAMQIASGQLLSKLAILGPALVSTFASTVLIRGLIDTTRRFEILKASLETATGSAEKANKVFREIQRIASTTPYSVEEITTAFIKLTNLGLNPGQAALRSYMNTASAMGKSLDQFIEAVADASVAEFERLKEFGIKAKNQGETIAFTFRGVKTEVQNNAQAIEGFLQSLGETQFGGAMARQAATLDGAISNLGDSWDGLKFTIAEAGVSSLMQDGVRGVSSAVDDLTNIIASGQIGAYLELMGSQWSGWADDILSAIDQVESAFPELLNEMQIVFGGMVAANDAKDQALITSLKEFPQNVRAMIKVLTVELASLIDVGIEYGAAFGKVVGVELAKLVKKAGIYGKELADIMAFWDGDTYDANAAIAQADIIANSMTNSYLAAADEQVEISRNARASTIQGIFNEREAALSSFNAQIAAANALAAARRQSAANDPQFDLGQFAVKPDKEASTPEAQVTDSELDKLRESLLSQEQLIEQHWLNRSSILARAWTQNKLTEDQFIALSLDSNKKYQDQLAAFNNARLNVIYSSGEQVFGAMASLAKNFGGEQSKAFKVMFAVQKGFAIAQGVLNLATAISNASALPFPINIPAIATAAAQGASLIANIKGAQYGQAHDGIRRVNSDNEGTYTVRRDEMVLNPKQRENFEQVVESTQDGSSKGGNVYHFKPTINIDATNATPGMEAKIKDQVNMALNEYDAKLQEDFSNNGTRSRLLTGRVA
jgi:hypothetical protein